MLKDITLIAALIVCGQIHAEIPKNPTKQQIIASYTSRTSLQQRVALQQCKTRLDAAELLQIMYQEDIERAERMSIETLMDGENSIFVIAGKAYKRDLAEIDALIVTLKAPKVSKKK